MTMNHPGSPQQDAAPKMSHAERERDDWLRRLALEQAVKLNGDNGALNGASKAAEAFYTFLTAGSKP